MFIDLKTSYRWLIFLTHCNRSLVLLLYLDTNRTYNPVNWSGEERTMLPSPFINQHYQKNYDTFFFFFLILKSKSLPFFYTTSTTITSIGFYNIWSYVCLSRLKLYSNDFIFVRKKKRELWMLNPTQCIIEMAVRTIITSSWIQLREEISYFLSEISSPIRLNSLCRKGNLFSLKLTQAKEWIMAYNCNKFLLVVELYFSIWRHLCGV
jgi:hypothetical protein